MRTHEVISASATPTDASSLAPDSAGTHSSGEESAAPHSFDADSAVTSAFDARDDRGASPR